MAQRDKKGVPKNCKCCMAPSGTDKRRFVKRETNKATRRCGKIECREGKKDG